MKMSACNQPSFRRWMPVSVAIRTCLATAFGATALAAAEPTGVQPAAGNVAGSVGGATGMAQLVSLTLDDVPLAEVVRLFTRISGANIIAATSNLQGQVTANLQDVMWKPAFESILERQNLQLIEKPPASGIFVIEGRKACEDPRVSTTIKLNYAKVSDVVTLVNSVLNKEGTVTPFPAANSIVISASVLKADEVRKIIEQLDRPRTQVSIETKIVQLSAGTSRKVGIDWQSLDAYKIAANAQGQYTRDATVGLTGSKNASHSYDQLGNEIPILDHYETITTPSGTLSVPIYKPAATTTSGRDSSVNSLRGLSAVLSPAQFNVVLSMLEGTTGAKLVSNPKVIIANEEKAIIKMAQDEPNLKTTVTRATVQGQSDQYATEIDGARPFFTYGITMEVTPRINTASNITVIIKPELSTKVSVKYAPDGINSFPIIEKKSVETIFSLSDGRTAAIGGLIETGDDDVTSKVPLLGDIPWLGSWLFSYKSRVKTQKEVLIFVTVRLVNPLMSADQELPSTSELYEKNYSPTAAKQTNNLAAAAAADTPKNDAATNAVNDSASAP